MGVAGARDVLGGGAELLGQRRFGDQGTGIGTNDVDSEDPVGLALGENFDKTLGIAIGPGARIGGERELAGAVGHAGGFELLLGLADGSYFGPSVDNRRNGVVIDKRLLAGEAFGDRYAFLLGLVREHRAANHIADRVDAGNVRRKPVIHDHPAIIVACDADDFEAEAVGVGPPADRDQHYI